MAKKRRRENEEPVDTYEFVAPIFDEKEFLLKDLYGTRVLMVVAVLAVVIGILAACIQKATDNMWYLGLLLIILAIVALKQLLTMLRFRADLIDQKMLFGNYILMFFLSLGIWIIMINPPF
ncbi:MAG: hypothetical protein LBE48_02570 [Methanomassiliicoccaceae archaeon]|jgi:hypothetical protein|nr:hypothetical protein [Methanomassiliicoccaceae archaeon]